MKLVILILLMIHMIMANQCSVTCKNGTSCSITCAKNAYCSCSAEAVCLCPDGKFQPMPIDEINDVKLKLLGKN